jgi:hypothetical protein
MEKIYFGFWRRLELMDINTVCDCNACVNMSSLDLKTFLHYGQYLVQQIGDQTDLQGSDVILAHLLMKNTVSEKSGLNGYGLVTRSAIEAMGVDAVAEGMIPHVENYEHYGDVDVFIHDLRQAWDNERDKRRIIVLPEDAVASAQVFIPVPQWTAWDIMQDIGIRLRYNDLQSIERTDSGAGRPGIGTAYHCLHKLGNDINYLYVDYDPPNYVTTESSVPGPTRLITNRILPVEGGSLFELSFGRPKEPHSEEKAAELQDNVEETIARFAKIIAAEIKAGNITAVQSAEISSRKQELARPGVAEGRFGQLDQ